MRRGEISTQLIVVVLLLTMAALILVTIGVRIMRQGDSQVDEGRCRSSIIEHSQLVRASAKTNVADIECHPRNVTIERRSAEKTQRALAQELATCWDRWQEGRVELFKDEGVYCNPCSIIGFEQRGAEVSLTEALEGEFQPGITYRKYLFPQATSGFEGAQPTQQSVLLDTDKKYAVVFYYDKNHTYVQLKEAMKRDPVAAAEYAKQYGTWAAIGGAVGGIIGTVGGIICSAGGGICAPLVPVFGKTGVVVGAGTAVAVVGVVSGAGLKDIKGVAVPEWMAMVIVVENEGEAYRQLGCKETFQASPEDVGTAERI